MNKIGFVQKTESNYEVLQMTNFLLSQHINLSPEQHLTGCRAICCIYYYYYYYYYYCCYYYYYYYNCYLLHGAESLRS